MRISQAMASASPAPTAGPGSAAMVGLRSAASAPVSSRCRSCRSATLSSNDMASFAWSRCAPMPLTLPPAQKALPAPVRSSTPTSGFSPQVLIMARNAGERLSDSALRIAGRFSVMIATWSRMTQRSSSVPVSILVSVVMVIPSIRQCEPTGAGEALDCFVVSLLAMTFASKLLDPRPQFQFPGPGAARLLQDIPVAQRNRIGIEHRVRPVRRLGSRCAAAGALDHEMGDMDALRRQFAGERLRKAPQAELAHCEGGGLGIALHAGGGTGEQHCAMLVGQHPLRRLLRHQKAAERADHDGLRDLRRYEVEKGTAGTRARIVDDKVGGGDLALHT